VGGRLDGAGVEDATAFGAAVAGVFVCAVLILSIQIKNKMKK
jgi:hypothetical protein